MNKRAILWLIPTLLFALFSAWYTDFGGPLSAEEVDEFVSTLQERGGDPDKIAHLERFLREDSGRQFLMFNALDLNANPPEVAGAAPGETGKQLMARYMQHMFVQLLQRACHPVVMGESVYSAIDLSGIEGAQQWTAGALVRYRSRRAFMEIVSNPATFARHRFKMAALNKTIAYPVEPQLYLGDLRLLFGLALLTLTALLDIALFGRRRHTT